MTQLVRLDLLTRVDFAAMMEDLVTAFGGSKTLEAKIELYYNRLRGFPTAAVRAAVDRILDEEHKFLPQVGRIKTYARQWIAEQKAKTGDKDEPSDEAIGRRCPDCREWSAIHRVIVVHSGTGFPLLALENTIRHQDRCEREPEQTRRMAFYRRLWADEITEPGLAQYMEFARRELSPIEWQGSGAPGADWSRPIGPLPPTLDELPPRDRNARRAGQRFKPLAAVLPKVLETIERGDAYEEPAHVD